MLAAALVGFTSGYAPALRPVAPQAVSTSRPASLARTAPDPRMVEFDTSTIIGLTAAIGGVVGGLGLIILTEKAGTRGNGANAQPCVECKGVQAVPCPICDGSGADPLASLVAGVREMTGDEEESVNQVTIQDWESGPKTVVMYEEVVTRYPVKARLATCRIPSTCRLPSTCLESTCLPSTCRIPTTCLHLPPLLVGR